MTGAVGLTLVPPAAGTAIAAPLSSEVDLKQLPAGSMIRLRIGGFRKAPRSVAIRLPDASEARDRFRSVAVQAAEAHDIPPDFFLRLIRQESGFDHRAVSPAGAQGIAQFMPATARERGLGDPFDPAQALPKSAELLRDLSRTFGNLGLAAAAYNAGAGRVRDWLAGRRGLPLETQHYVQSVTGRSASAWAPAGVRLAAVPVKVRSAPHKSGGRPSQKDWELEILRTVTNRNAATPALLTAASGSRGLSVTAAVGRQARGARSAEAALCPGCISRSSF